jgi:hydroxylamine dehydrogenase
MKIRWVRFMIVSMCSVLLIAACAATEVAPPVVSASISSKTCIECQTKNMPDVVSDWMEAGHYRQGVGCAECHGTEHTSATDSSKAQVAGLKTCSGCHEKQVTQFMGGKHALAWKCSVNMPTFSHIPRVLIEGGKGCGGCHKFGAKDEKDLTLLDAAGSRTQGGAAMPATPGIPFTTRNRVHHRIVI